MLGHTGLKKKKIKIAGSDLDTVLLIYVYLHNCGFLSGVVYSDIEL